jgi:hypothetical protein
MSVVRLHIPVEKETNKNQESYYTEQKFTVTLYIHRYNASDRRCSNHCHHQEAHEAST